MQLKQIVYVSAARSHLLDSECIRILETARRRNAENDITGVLLSIDQGFLQILEGPDHAVDETFDRISRDPRHTAVRILHAGPCDHRSFGSWRMGFDDISGRDLTMPDAFPLSKAALMAELPATLGPEVLIFVRTFFAVNAAA
jgi:hypothetical protein